ncbi:serine/threonine-protein kinase [Nocardiopsis sp. FIRDI 009]|uniref:serine/threonine-protein kinase n=1 Tax=Nocardiopsis sp. FIRDI 009 TaxID=714197 RepID=UPI000E229E72|nr:serine/threonine-protein kinase [Nocardiopsis sp. FIRDI 009]
MPSNSDPERIVADRYVLRRELGRGGMGVVWEAFDPTLDRVVALKQVLLPDHFTEAERRDAHARVRREARSAARVNHPTVITIHDVFVFEDDPWVVMELIEGGSLRDLLTERGALDTETVATIAESLLRAVRAADEVGVLHRDIKPGNIMMSTDGRVVLTDFGIATMEGGPSITRTGALIGSPEYMPPERLAGGPAEHRGDLWSIGVTLFAAVEGASPFHRDSITAAIAAVMSAPLPPMRRAGWLAPVISGLLERDPDRRLSADEALALLRDRGFGGTGERPSARGGAQPSGGVVPGPAGHPGGAGSGFGPGAPRQAPSGGYPAPGTAPAPPAPAPSATSGWHGSTTPPPGHGPAPQGPGYPSPPPPQGGTGAVVPPGGHGGGRGSGKGSGRGSTGRLLIGLGAAGLAVALIVVGAAAFLARSGGDPTAPGADGSTAGLTDSPVAEQSAPGTDTEYEDRDGGGDPPSYDDLVTFRSRWFEVDYPDGWTVDDTAIDEARAYFVAPGYDQHILVTGWTEQVYDRTSAEFLEDTNGGTSVVAGDVTTDYRQLELEQLDSGDFPDAWNEEWDVARVTADFDNEEWATQERRFWRYVISFEGEGQRIFYLVSVNVPRADADFYDDLPEEVVESFAPAPR